MLQNLRIGLRKRRNGKSDVSVKQRGGWPKYPNKEKHKATFFSPSENWCLPAPLNQKPEEREFVVDSGASMHMISKKDLNSAELETVTTSRSPTTQPMVKCRRMKRPQFIMSKNWGIFLTRKVLEDTPAVFIARKA